MSKYEELPLYKSCYDLLLYSFSFTKNFSREYKYTIGENLKKDIMDLTIMLYKANKSASKYEILENAREKTERIRLQVRVLKDLRQINLKRFVFVNTKIETISKQLTGWQKSQK